MTTDHKFHAPKLDTDTDTEDNMTENTAPTCDHETAVWGPNEGCKEFMDEPDAIVRCEFPAVQRVVLRHFYPPDVSDPTDTGEEDEVVHFCEAHRMDRHEPQQYAEILEMEDLTEPEETTEPEQLPVRNFTLTHKDEKWTATIDGWGQYGPTPLRYHDRTSAFERMEQVQDLDEAEMNTWHDVMATLPDIVIQVMASDVTPDPVWMKGRWDIAKCDTCGDETFGRSVNVGLKCGRDLSEEHGQEAGTTICSGTYR